jgi:hypothetical protein
MSHSLREIALQLSSPRMVKRIVAEKEKEIEESRPVPKTQIIYAFNGTGKTRLSSIFKNLVAPKSDATEDSPIKILYYNAFTEDLFYWDNDLKGDRERKLIIRPNIYTHWAFVDQGIEGDAIAHFQRYTNSKITPRFNLEYTKEVDGKIEKIPAYSEVTFSFGRGNEQPTEYVKISKGEESNFIWSIFYAFIEEVIDVLNVAEPGDRPTHDFDRLEYIFIDDPVSSLDENHLIQLAIDLSALIKSSKSSDLKFIVTTHNPLFFNVLFNEIGNAQKYILSKSEDGTCALLDQKGDSPFAYHLFLKSQLEQAAESGEIHKYHFNFLRNILEKTSTFVGHQQWGSLLPPNDGVQENPYARIINLNSHSKHSGEEVANVSEDHKRAFKFLVKKLSEMYQLKMLST